MKKFNKVIAFILAALMLATFTACSDDADTNAENNDLTDVNDAASGDEFEQLESELKVFFEELYSAFNEKRFEDYLTYLNVTDETVRANMLNSFNSATQYYSTTCELETLDAKQFDDGLINAALSLITTTVTLGNEEAAPVKIREVVYYNLEESGDTFSVKNYTAGGSQMITDLEAEAAE